MQPERHHPEIERTRRRRRRWIIIAVIVVVVIGIGALVLGPPLHWAYTVHPQPTMDGRAELIALTARGQPEGENAWPLWLEAYEILKAVEDDIRARDFAPRNEFDEPPSFWQMALFSDFDFESMEPEREAIELLRERGFFDLTARAAAAPRAVFDGYPPGPVQHWGAGEDHGSVLGYVGSRRILDVKLALMRQAAIEGDWSAFVQGLEEALAFVFDESIQPSSFDYLAAFGNRAKIEDHVLYVLGEFAAPEAALAEVAGRFDRIATLGSINRVLEAERIAMNEFIDHIYESHDDGRLIPSALHAWQRTVESARSAVSGEAEKAVASNSRITNLRAFLFPSRDELERFLERAFADLESWVHIDPFAARAMRPFDGEGLDRELVERFGWVEGPFEVLQRLVIAPQGFVVRFEATRILVAIERYRIAHAGVLPFELRDLTPRFLDEVPIDPATGEEFIYRQTDDEFGFMLYSMGLDGEDNLGDEGDGYALIDLENGRGFDAVFGRQARPSSNPGADARNEKDD